MLKRFLPIVTLGLWSISSVLFLDVAKAETLQWATVRTVKNQVRLLLQGEPPRDAKTNDRLRPNDSLATGRRSRAELRFSDRSLARLGELALFRFVPNTRNFYLNNGTTLLLIPPGRGRTNVITPNATAGVRGSALFVRYSPDTNTTIVGALTNSQIEVLNQDGTQAAPLRAGQMAILVNNQLIGISNFDLNHFYQTSPLTEGLDLTQQSSPDEAIAAVQAETTEGIASQSPLTGSGLVTNPNYLQLASTSMNPYDGSANHLSSLNPALQSGIDRGLSEGITPISSPNPNQFVNNKGKPGVNTPPISTDPQIPARPPVAGAPSPGVDRPNPGTRPDPAPITPPPPTPRPNPAPITPRPNPAPITPPPPTPRPDPAPITPRPDPAPITPRPDPAPITPPAPLPVPNPTPIVTPPPQTRPDPAPVITPTPVPRPEPGALPQVIPATPAVPAAPGPAAPAIPASPALTAPAPTAPAPIAPVVSPPPAPVVTPPAPIVTPPAPVVTAPVLTRPDPALTTVTTPTVAPVASPVVTPAPAPSVPPATPAAVTLPPPVVTPPAPTPVVAPVVTPTPALIAPTPTTIPETVTTVTPPITTTVTPPITTTTPTTTPPAANTVTPPVPAIAAPVTPVPTTTPTPAPATAPAPAPTTPAPTTPAPTTPTTP